MRFIPPIILVTALCLAGCSSTVTGTAESAGVGASGTSSTPPSKDGSPSTSSSPTAPQTRTSTYDTSLVGVADFPKGTAYTVVSLTPVKVLSAFEGIASQVTSTPSGCYFTPAVSKDVLTADGTALATFKQPNGDTAIEVIASDALVDRDALVKKANECASFTAKSGDASFTGTFTTSTSTDSKTALMATLISRTISDGTITAENDSIIGYAKGAVAVFTFSFYKAGNPDQKPLVTKMTAITLAKLAAAL